MNDAALELIKRKDGIEEEILALTQDLNSPGANGEPAAGVRGSLLDGQGFPRADIDLYAVRTKRGRLACLQTDHKQIMSDIEHALTQIHSQSAENPAATPPPAPTQPSSNIAEDSAALQEAPVEQVPVEQAPSGPPFALIDEVADGGPANEAGLKVGDKVVRFGNIDCNNNANLSALSGLVSTNINQTIELWVQRGQDRLKLPLKPMHWSGRGLLGCHLKPIQE